MFVIRSMKGVPIMEDRKDLRLDWRVLFKT